MSMMVLPLPIPEMPLPKESPKEPPPRWPKD
jgi:hypothetical protein